MNFFGLLIYDARFSHLVSANPALLSEEPRQVAHNLVAALSSHPRNVRLVSLNARDRGMSNHRSRGDAALYRRADAKHRRSARQLATIGMGGKFEHSPRVATLVNLRERLDR